MLICYSPHIDALFSSCWFVIMFMLINCFSYVLVHCVVYVRVSLFLCVSMLSPHALVCYFACIIMSFFSCQFAIHLLWCCCSFHIDVVDPLTQVLGCCNSSHIIVAYYFLLCVFIFVILLHLLNVPIGPTSVIALLVLALLLFSQLVWYFPPFLPYVGWNSKHETSNIKSEFFSFFPYFCLDFFSVYFMLLLLIMCHFIFSFYFFDLFFRILKICI